MYQVISVRVLRQVMDWMGIPCPWFRTTDFFRWSDGRLTSTIKCMWNYQEIGNWAIVRWNKLQDEPFPTTPEDYGRTLYRILVSTFCDDVQVVMCRYEPGPHWFVAYLTCTVTPRDKLIADVDNYINELYKQESK